MNYYLKCWNHYADFKGRARRMEYWMFVLFNVIAAIICSMIDLALGSSNVITACYGLAMFIPSLAVAVRRLHDIGKSGWWYLISFIPFVGTIWLLVLLFLDSVPYDNEWGANPKA